MAEYKEIHGTKIRNYTTNPDNPITGEVWYNDTDNVLKFQYENVSSAGSWATGGTMNTARRRLAGAGSYTAALAITGTADPPLYANTELYGGVTWTEVNDVNTAREETAAGGKTSTSALLFGGNEPSRSNATELWNGTNWTSVNDLGTARGENAGNGTDNTSCLCFGGLEPTASAKTNADVLLAPTPAA